MKWLNILFSLIRFFKGNLLLLFSLRTEKAKFIFWELLIQLTSIKSKSLTSVIYIKFRLIFQKLREIWDNYWHNITLWFPQILRLLVRTTAVNYILNCTVAPAKLNLFSCLLSSPLTHRAPITKRSLPEKKLPPLAATAPRTHHFRAPSVAMHTSAEY